MITDLIWRTVQKDRPRQKYVVFDECWKLLKNESALVFIEEVFRTFRKYYASAIAISQDLCDFANSKISSALIPNCSIKWILIQNQNDLSRMTEVLGLNPNELSLIQSLEQKKGYFSEAYLLSGQKNRSVVTIEPTAMDLWLATTDPRDLSEIQREKERSPALSNWEILKLLSQKYPHGMTV
jgi:type IV secretory pathway VirB4 component